MKKNAFATAAMAALFVLTIGKKEGQSTKHDSGEHPSSFSSGYDYGKHVTEHNGHFSGTMNPGKHHQGYSTLKPQEEDE